MSDRIKILIVDDNDSVLKIIKQILCDRPNSPFECECVSTLRHCLAICKAGHAEYVLLDLDLPDALGFEGPIQLKDQCPNVKIIIITGSGNQFSKERAKFELGVLGYIEKPVYDLEEFYMTVSQAIFQDIKEERDKKLLEEATKKVEVKSERFSSKLKKILKYSAITSAILGALTALLTLGIKFFEFLRSIGKSK